MINSEKKLKELEARLHDRNPLMVIDTIEWLRSEDPFAGAISLITGIYNESDNPTIRNKIRDFMNDLKESSARAEVISEIKKSHKQSTLAMLVSSCWQSGLDYSSYASDLAALFNTSDYETALECFTVIEESAVHMSGKDKKDLIRILRSGEGAHSPDKKALMVELITILS